MSIIQGTAKGGAVAASLYDYPVSLRFDGSSYLSRGFSGGNANIHTISVWVKRTELTGSGHTDAIFSAGDTADTNRVFLLGFENDNIKLWGFSPDAFNKRYQRTTNAVFRDLSAWYHVVAVIDFTNQSGHDRVKLYVNGSQITSFSNETTNDPSSGTSAIGYSYDYNIGRYNYASKPIIKGAYMANIQFIDGQALDQYFFGEFIDNIWVPYNAFSTAGSGTATASDGDTATDSYGTNGFHLTFENGIESLPVGGYTGSQNAFRDKSHNTNHWKIN